MFNQCLVYILGKKATFAETVPSADGESLYGFAVSWSLGLAVTGCWVKARGGRMEEDMMELNVCWVATISLSTRWMEAHTKL